MRSYIICVPYFFLKKVQDLFGWYLDNAYICGVIRKLNVQCLKFRDYESYLLHLQNR